MANITEDTIEEYFEEIVTFNERIFGLHEKADLKEVNYIFKIKRVFFTMMEKYKKCQKEFSDTYDFNDLIYDFGVCIL